MAHQRPKNREAAFNATLSELFAQPVGVSSMEDTVDALKLLYYHQHGTLPPETAASGPIPGARGRRKKDPPQED